MMSEIRPSIGPIRRSVLRIFDFLTKTYQFRLCLINHYRAVLFFPLLSVCVELKTAIDFSRREMTTAIGYALLTTFTVLLSYTSLSHGLLQPRRISHGLSASGKYLTRDELWFNQTLDHFSPYVKSRFFDLVKGGNFLFDSVCFFFFCVLRTIASSDRDTMSI